MDVAQFLELARHEGVEGGGVGAFHGSHHRFLVVDLAIGKRLKNFTGLFALEALQNSFVGILVAGDHVHGVFGERQGLLHSLVGQLNGSGSVLNQAGFRHAREQTRKRSFRDLRHGRDAFLGGLPPSCEVASSRGEHEESFVVRRVPWF